MENGQIVRDFKGSKLIEKLMYGVGDAGGALLLSIPGSYLTLYCTDSLGLGAAFLGTMLLICRLFDGISDVIMGIVIDKTNTKFGKARPWFVVSIIPLVLSFYALFNVPSGLSESGKIAYIYVVYFLMAVVFYTVNNIAYHAMLQRFSLTSQDRASVSAVRSFLCILFSAILNIAVPIAIPVLGGEGMQHTWTVIAAVVAVASLFFLCVTALGIKERLVCDDVNKTDEERKKAADDNKKALSFVLRNRYFYLLIIISLIWFATINMMGIGYYYARDILGNGALSSVLIMAGMLPSLFSMPFIGYLFGRFGKRKVTVIGLIVAAAASLAIYMNPISMPLNIVCLVIKCIASSPLAAGVATLAGDVTDLCESNIGIRVEGLTTSAYSIGVKLGTGLGGALVAWGLALGGYNYLLEVQTEGTLIAIKAVFIMIPAILYILGAIFMMFWNLDEK